MDKVQPPGSNSWVYREECTRCFDSQDFPAGIDVCLTCFNGGCGAESPHCHGAEHARIAGHKNVVNIRRRIRDDFLRDAQPLKKLAIEEAPSEHEKYVFDTVIGMYDDASRFVRVENESVPENVHEAVRGILSSTLASKKSDVKAWEDVIEPCEHTRNLVQVPELMESSDDSHCRDCEADKGLWMCLSCKYIGCGRPQYGATGIANGHALHHSQAMGHPVVVKLGTITPDGAADVHCYACDEARQDPKLREHLLHLGLRLADQVKTEKNMTEMTIDQMHYTFETSASDRGQIKRLWGPGFTGLQNLGNSCYMSSTLQSLFGLDLFTRLDDLRLDRVPVGEAPATNLITQLGKLAHGLLSGRYSQPDIEYASSIRPFMLKNVIGSAHRDFAGSLQQDADEFLRVFLDIFSKSAQRNHTFNVEPWFESLVESRIQCSSCSAVNYKTDTQNVVSVETPSEANEESTPQSSLMDCIKRTLGNQSVKDFFCPNCANKVTLAKNYGFQTAPRILVLHALRFKLLNWVPTKVAVPIHVPDELDLGELRASGVQPGEVLMPESDDAALSAAGVSASDFSPDVIAQIVALGFSEAQATHALAQNGGSPDAAAMWLFENPDAQPPTNTGSGSDPAHASTLTDMGFAPGLARRALAETNNNVEVAAMWLFENPDAEPLDETPAPQTSSNGPDPELVSNLVDMGFSEGVARRALFETNSNTDAAIEYLFANPDAEPLEEKDIPAPVPAGVAFSPDGHAKYRLKAFISHKGTSVHSGHYVAHVKKNDSWAFFNDESVSEVHEEDTGPDSFVNMKSLAYVYFYERIDVE